MKASMGVPGLDAIRASTSNFQWSFLGVLVFYLQCWNAAAMAFPHTTFNNLAPRFDRVIRERALRNVSADHDSTAANSTAPGFKPIQNTTSIMVQSLSTMVSTALPQETPLIANNGTSMRISVKNSTMLPPSSGMYKPGSTHGVEWIAECGLFRPNKADWLNGTREEWEHWMGEVWLHWSESNISSIQEYLVRRYAPMVSLEAMKCDGTGSCTIGACDKLDGDLSPHDRQMALYTFEMLSAADHRHQLVYTATKEVAQSVINRHWEFFSQYSWAQRVQKERAAKAKKLQIAFHVVMALLLVATAVLPVVAGVTVAGEAAVGGAVIAGTTEGVAVAAGEAAAMGATEGTAIAVGELVAEELVAGEAAGAANAGNTAATAAKDTALGSPKLEEGAQEAAGSAARNGKALSESGTNRVPKFRWAARLKNHELFGSSGQALAANAYIAGFNVYFDFDPTIPDSRAQDDALTLRSAQNMDRAVKFVRDSWFDVVGGKARTDRNLFIDYFKDGMYLGLPYNDRLELTDRMEAEWFAMMLDITWKVDRPYIVRTRSWNCEADNRGNPLTKVCLAEEPNMAYWMYTIHKGFEHDRFNYRFGNVRSLPGLKKIVNSPEKHYNITPEDIVRSSMFVHETGIQDFLRDGSGAEQASKNIDNVAKTRDFGKFPGIFRLPVCNNPNGEAISATSEHFGLYTHPAEWTNYPCMCGDFAWHHDKGFNEYSPQRDETKAFLLQSSFSHSDDWQGFCHHYNHCHRDKETMFHFSYNDTMPDIGDPKHHRKHALVHPWRQCRHRQGGSMLSPFGDTLWHHPWAELKAPFHNAKELQREGKARKNGQAYEHQPKRKANLPARWGRIEEDF